MRVLLTGVTSTECGVNKVKSCWDTELIHKALLAGGHSVDRRPVIAGESLADYDVAVIGQQKLVSINAFKHRYGALWAASQLPFLVFYEDQAKDLNAYRNGLKPRYLWDYPTAKLAGPALEALRDGARRYRETLDGVVESFKRGEQQAIMIAYRWGNLNRVRELLPGNITGIDLTAFYDTGVDLTLTRKLEAPQRRWIFATLVHENKWRFDPRKQATWPVESLGWPQWAEDTALQRGGFRGKKLTRDGLISRYLASRGIMTWPYKSPAIIGSGIWRDRFHDAIAVRRVAWFQPDEVGGMGARSYLRPIAEIEQMTDEELNTLAHQQAMDFTEAQLPANEAAAALTRRLEEVRGG